MKTQAFIDREEIEQILRTSKANRVKFLQQESAKTAGSMRWGGVGALIASGLALFVGHHSTFGRYF